MTDACVVDEEPAQAGLQVDVGRHLPEDLVETVVLEHHRKRVHVLAGGAEALLGLLQVRELRRLEVLHCKAANRRVDHRRNKKEVPQSRVVHRDDPRPPVLANIDVALTRQAAENIANRRSRQAVPLAETGLSRSASGSSSIVRI
ncbi:hypothetical protein AJ87_46305 [Rhizobium yanglingense]|nr:hypothetical protein AJ87_46305 [Rhizobium yanglingense]